MGQGWSQIGKLESEQNFLCRRKPPAQNGQLTWKFWWRPQPQRRPSLPWKIRFIVSNQDSRWKTATYSIFQDGSTPAPDLDGQVCAHDDGRPLSLPQWWPRWERATSPRGEFYVILVWVWGNCEGVRLLGRAIMLQWDFYSKVTRAMLRSYLRANHGEAEYSSARILRFNRRSMQLQGH